MIPEDMGKWPPEDVIEERKDQPCPFAGRFGTVLDVALGDGASPVNPKVSELEGVYTFEAEIRGIVHPDLKMILQYITDDYRMTSLHVTIYNEDGESVLYEESSTPSSAPDDVDDPRGFCHRAATHYFEERCDRKISQIKADVHDCISKLQLLTW
jgi:hypothetical protein